MAVRHLYLTRHAEPGEDGRLTERGVQQAGHLGRRLSRVRFASLQHGPSLRTTETALQVAQELGPGAEMTELDAAGDHVPHPPSAAEIDSEHRDGVMAFLTNVSPGEAARGAVLGEEAVRRLTGPEFGDQDSHHLVVTHAFTVGWLVCHAMDPPPWRWLGLDNGHAALTVIRYSTSRPPAVVVFNDMSHLPQELRWTGFPAGTGL